MSCIFHSQIIYIACSKGIALLINHCPYSLQTHTKKSFVFCLVGNSHLHTVTFIVTTKVLVENNEGCKCREEKNPSPTTNHKVVTTHLSNSQPLIHFLFTAREALYEWRTMHKHTNSLSKITEIRPRGELKTCFPLPA